MAMTTPVPRTPAAPDRPEVFYPESDGRPLGETGFHVVALLLLHQALRTHLAAIGRTDSYVASDMFLYYEEGNPKANRSPDTMVILGVDGHERRTFKTWVEGTVPSAIIEITSDETWREDLHTKRDLYARLGIPEYFLFDPLGDCLDPPLQGFRLEGRRYVPLVPDAEGALGSAILGLRLRPEGIMLRLIDARTNEPILTADEVRERMEQATAQAERERRRAELEERRARREKQKAERQKQKAEQEKQRAERQKQKAERERQKAEQEKQRADALAAEVERLRAMLDQGKAPD
jgi:Uma2 family endonuclease